MSLGVSLTHDQPICDPLLVTCRQLSIGHLLATFIRHLLATFYWDTTVWKAPRKKQSHRIRQRWSHEMISEAGLQGRWVIVYFRDFTETKTRRIRKGHLIRANYLVPHCIHRLCVLQNNSWPNNMSNTQTLSEAK